MLTSSSKTPADGAGPVLGDADEQKLHRRVACDRCGRGAISSIGQVSADDRDLLKFRAAKPYLFILLDSSGSMNLQIGADDLPAEGHGDDPVIAHLGRQGSSVLRSSTTSMTSSSASPP